jgi:hypothetical protein
MSGKLDSYEDVRRLKRLQHRDNRGLQGLMREYLALGDELEEIPGRNSLMPPPSRSRAA